MVDYQLLLFVVVMLTAALGLVIGLVAFSYRQLIKKYYLLKEQEEKEAESSREESEKIVTDAEARAKKIIEEATDLGKKLQTDLLLELEQAKKEQAKAYQAILDTVQKESYNMVNNISDDVKKQISLELARFLKSLEGEIGKSQEAVMGALKSEYQKVQVEIRQYQDEMQKRVDESVYKILETVANRVLGKTIELEEHEELVMKALNDAKRENLF
jgi:vacuolar-type H+-ATPase subunit H